jgi:hypothetical protein
MGQFKVEASKSSDGRQLIKVRFVRQSPDSDSTAIVAVFQYVFPESFCFTEKNPGVLALLSVARSDTFESALLTEEERQMVYSAAAEQASELVNTDED